MTGQRTTPEMMMIGKRARGALLRALLALVMIAFLLPTIPAAGIGTPADYRTLALEFQDSGVDQMIFLQQGGKNSREHILESLELFGNEVYPDFAAERDDREARKADELAPYIEAALERKNWMRELSDDEIPVVPASRERDAFYHKD